MMPHSPACGAQVGLLLILIMLTAPLPLWGQSVRTVKAPPTQGSTLHYVGNRPPLVPNRLVKLPLGSIRPLGWLRYQCQALADGLTGHLDEISQFCRIEGSAWVDPAGQGHSPWEEAPYWLRGLTHLAYVLDDPVLKAKALRWLVPMMRYQRPDGYFGTDENRKSLDLWPNMLILDALKVHYEATGDERVLAFMERYFQFQGKINPNLFLFRSWQKIRGGDNLDSIYWLYNRTGGRGLLDLAEVNHRNTARWYEYIPTPHGVNIAQGFKEPAIFYQQNRDPLFLKSAYRVYESVLQFFGRVPGGMFGADEVCREGYDGPRQGAETCSMMEFMSSHLFLAGLTGDTTWSDRCEDVAFNSLPAAFAPDMKGLHYLTAPNQPRLDRKDKSPMINNEGEMFTYRADLYRCCLHNAGLGWSVFAENLFGATRDGGLAALLYAPCEVRARVGSAGREVVLRERTGYPFRESIVIEVISGPGVSFPLYLRVPGWCKRPEFSLNGRPLDVKAQPLEWVVIERAFKTGDVVRVNLPMNLQLVSFDNARAGFSLKRGPLSYSLKIGETWKRRGGRKGWPGWEVFPSTPWNYSPVDSKLEVVERTFKPRAQVFTPDNAPVYLRLKGRKVLSWGLEKNGMVQEIGASPIQSAEPLEEITLIPMGCAQLRISVFPRLEP